MRITIHIRPGGESLQHRGASPPQIASAGRLWDGLAKLFPIDPGSASEPTVSARLTRWAVLAVVLLLTPATSRAQGHPDDPLLGNHVLGDSAELLLVTAQTTLSATRPALVDQTIFDFLSLNNPLFDDELSEEGVQSESGALGIDDDFTLDAVTCDLNGDPLADLVAVWQGPNRSINLIVPKVRSGTLDWTQSNATTLLGPETLVQVPGPFEASEAQLRLVAGHFDADAQNELLLAYWAADGTIRMRVYDTNGSLTLVEKATIADEALPLVAPSSVEQSAHFDVTTGDLDGDGLHEIVLVGAEQIPSGCTASSGCWQLWVKVYDYDPDIPAILPRGRAVLFTKTDGTERHLEQVAVTTADLDGDGVDEVAVGYLVAQASGTSPWLLDSVDVSTDLLTVTPADSIQHRSTNAGSISGALSLAAADLRRDGRELIVFASRNRVSVYQADDALLLSLTGNGNYTSNRQADGHRSVVIADLDADNDIAIGVGDWRPEVIIANNVSIDTGSGIDGFIQIVVLEANVFPGGFINLDQRAKLLAKQAGPSAARPFVLAAGDFGGNGVRVGTPSRFRKTEIRQPIVVLNAPPTHFDVFGGQNFDVNRCYNANIGSCQFTANYFKQNSMTMEVETQVHTDWGTTLRAEGGFTIPIIDVGVKASMAATHREGFSKYKGITQTFSTSISKDAIRDDQILATVADYDIWEYPVLANGKLEAYIAVVKPIAPRLQWFPSKSWTAAAYFPAHEVGNILSYPSLGGNNFDETLNPALDEAVLIPLTATTLDETCCTAFNVSFGSFATASTEKSIFNGISGSVDFDIPISVIPDIGVDGDYGIEEISTHTSSVGLELQLNVQLGGIDTAIGGGPEYTVRPYSYWGTHGALVVDYAVQLALSSNPTFDTWWQERYATASDPAFLLPFRYDFEKGLAGNDAMRNETRDIVFTPAEPVPGETVVTTARIQNYSLIPTPGPVKVRFFLEDPGASGTAPLCSSSNPATPCAIVGTLGETDVLTRDGFGNPVTIGAQDNALVSLEWIVPQNVPSGFLRVYAVVDPDGQIPEVHENNNKGAISVTRLPEPSLLAQRGATLVVLVALARRRLRAPARS